MTTRRARTIVTLVAAFLIGEVSPLLAQGFELTPFAAYRFGGDLFEVVAGQPLDIDGAPAVGVMFDVPLSDGFHVEGLLSHQEAVVWAPLQPLGPSVRWRIAIDHWQAGGLQEFGNERVRPFTTGMLGLTRYAADADSEVRLSFGAGGGVKWFPVAHVGARIDGRVFATLIDADGTRLACREGACLVGLHLNLAWQAEFSAGVFVRFP
jgi:hypothetical protein